MYQILLTQYSGKILGPVARLLGLLLDGIYTFLDKVCSIQNIGLCIILITVIIYLCMLPLTMKQQKFARLNRIMAPELKEIQNKYRGRRDSASQMQMQEETRALYDKYGVSPIGSCLQMLIQIPIIWALYRVIYNVPAYIPAIKEKFGTIVNVIVNTDGYQNKLQTIKEAFKINTVNLDFSDAATIASQNIDFSTADAISNSATASSIVDLVYRLSSDGWIALKDAFSGVTDAMQNTIYHYTYFLGMNISESPWILLRSGVGALAFGGIMIVILAGLTQFINIRVTQSANVNASGDSMATQMKLMNYFMPIFSIIMVFTLPVGVGIYWIAGASIRTVLQVISNKHYDKIKLDDIIEKNKEKAKRKAEKRKKKLALYEGQIRSAASMSTRNIDTSKIQTKASRDENVQYKKGSLASKANLVSEYNKKKNK